MGTSDKEIHGGLQVEREITSLFAAVLGNFALSGLTNQNPRVARMHSHCTALKVRSVSSSKSETGKSGLIHAKKYPEAHPVVAHCILPGHMQQETARRSSRV